MATGSYNKPIVLRLTPDLHAALKAAAAAQGMGVSAYIRQQLIKATQQRAA